MTGAAVRPHRGLAPQETQVDGRGYRPSWGWTDRLDAASRERIDLHDGEPTNLDAAIGDVPNLLRRAGVYDDTAVIVTADHGENVQERNARFEHREPYETTVGVPLIHRPPAGTECESGLRVEGLVGHAGLMPTLLDLAGHETRRGVAGTSRLPPVRRKTEATHDALHSWNCGARLGRPPH